MHRVRGAGSLLSVGLAGFLATATLAGEARGQRAWRTPGEEDAAEGRRLAREGRCEEAIEAFDRAAHVRREDATVRRDRGACHEQLGATRPAIDDYRAYLAAEPKAPDAPAIRARLEGLEADARANEPPPPPPPKQSPTSSPDSTPDDETARGEHVRLPSAGFLLGVHLGYRDWNSALAGQTLSIGAEGGWLYAPGSEVTVRVAFLDTNELDTSGWGASAAHGWSISLDDTMAIVLSVGGGFETQENDFRVRRNFFFGRATPSFRYTPMRSVLLQAGPELGIGSMPAASETVADTTPDAEDTHLGIYWGGRLELLWVIGG